LRDEWCRDIPTKAQWVKGHADREIRERTQDERLNIEADLMADETRANVRGPYRARPNCPHWPVWPVEKATLFNESDKWHETAIIITALRREAERLYHR
jgi:hypothetical protein